MYDLGLFVRYWHGLVHIAMPLATVYISPPNSQVKNKVAAFFLIEIPWGKGMLYHRDSR